MIGLIIVLFSCAESPISAGDPTINIPNEQQLEETQSGQIKEIFISPEVPMKLVESIKLPSDYLIITDAEAADLSLVTTDEQGGNLTWVYVLVSPFPTVTDDVSLSEIQSSWNGNGITSLLFMTEETKSVFISLWGTPADGGVEVMNAEALQELAVSDQSSLVIIPFEELNPRWKVLSIDGESPIHKDLDVQSYPLAVHFEFTGDPVFLEIMQNDISTGRISFSSTNYEPERMTVVLLTGTTALVRTTAVQMETKGIEYPGEQIREWMLEPDVTHVSNEASFTENCPDPNDDVISVQFCSKPEYIELFNYVGVDVVEQTGNHLLNFGAAGMEYSLELYAQHGIMTYGGGRNDDEARQPLLIEKNGSKIALLGCNNSESELEWATADKPGAAHCDFEWMAAEIAQLKDQGYVVIVTLQELEGYSAMPMSWVRDNFILMAEAGADIVSGSQAHFPQGFEFSGKSFIHYGLGNLFFDQMDFPVTGTRREFLDRYVIYDGRLISVELLTAMLEDYAQPRPMTIEERQQFLQDTFSASGW